MRTVRSPSDYANVLKWFNNCRLEHTNSCGQAGGNEFPLRVIDCAARKLCIIPSKSRYLCLSYVWGVSSASHAPLSGDDLPEQLPSTVADAMKVALVFEIPYLWVDRYCIDQDNAEEKHNLIRNMDKIYRNADLTIVAATGEDAAYGLPRVSNTHRRLQTVTTESLAFVSWANITSEIMGSTWMSRGWTFQEMLLSSRCLFFADSQMVGVCKHDCYVEYEMGDRYSSSLLKSSRLNDLSVRGLHAALKSYYSRALTFMSDTLDAFEGVFNAFREIDGIPQHFSYFWGIPVCVWTDEETLAAGLLWDVRTGRRYDEPGPPEPLERYTSFPSWSWAAHKVDTAGSVHHDLHMRAIKISDQPLRIMDEKHCGVSIEVTRRHDGAVVDLWTYVQLQDHYLEYLPHLDVHCWCIKGEIGMEGKSVFTFLTNEGETCGGLRLDFTGNFLGREALAIFVEYNDPETHVREYPVKWFPHYFLVEPVEYGMYRRLGHIWSSNDITRGWELRKIRLI